MNGLEVGICDLPLASGAAPEWVHLLPGTGRIAGRDGRSWELPDANALVTAFQSGGIDLPVDFEHQNDRPEAKLSGPVPAAGWIKTLKADEGGLWGRVEWTATAAEMIARKEYRFLSPSFLFDPKTGRIIRLKGAGLVHNPNLHLTALASQEPAMPPQNTPPTPAAAPLMQRLAKMLGLASDATEEALIDALTAALDGKAETAPDPAKYVPVATVQAMLAERNLSLATASEGRAVQKVADAMRRGFLSPAMKDWAIALCTTNEASFDAFLESTVPPFAHLTQTSDAAKPFPGRAAPAAQTEAEAAICAQLGLPPGSLAKND